MKVKFLIEFPEDLIDLTDCEDWSMFEEMEFRPHIGDMINLEEFIYDADFGSQHEIRDYIMQGPFMVVETTIRKSIDGAYLECILEPEIVMGDDDLDYLFGGMERRN